MKFICIRCNEYMNQIKADVSGENSINIIFKCSQCGNKIAMITNPQETQMVRTLGLNIGGNTKSSNFLEEDIAWTKEAEDRFKRIPSFVQSMARQSIINYAKENGIKEITVRVMDEVKEKAGM